MKKVLKAFILSEEGATAVEYAIMASLIAVVIVTAVALLGTNTNSLYQSVSNAMSGKW
jgi:pilus assembly protein Flp/PilA